METAQVIAEAAKRTAAASGVPERVSCPDVIQSVAQMLGGVLDEGHLQAAIDRPE